MAWTLTVRFRVKEKAMPPLTGLKMLGSALAAKMPRRGCFGRRKGTGDRVEPVPPRRRRGGKMVCGWIYEGRTGPQMGLKERTRPGCRGWRPDHGIGRRQSSVRSGISVVTAANNCPAPSGAASSRGTIQSPLSPGRGRSPIPLDAATESARGQAHSKSWRMNPARQWAQSVVECGSLLPLSATVAALPLPGAPLRALGNNRETLSGEPDSFTPFGGTPGR